ncbi:hypothetical protein Pan44_48020 [Caulifigura coniformis]|uniref:Uncharacterized protein n=1 Tax=Caulifigura coniformis TaxID=2527983 RepID=A0A517SKU8_9PLAN|nr:hypothetical protein [Caulifigura coniformis]QDT56742.1 hypothetical protein Pan44_48020 [Caulifigura coniformis]
MAKKGSLRRKAVGAGALGLVALGIWLGQYFPGFGLGKGLGFGTGSGDSGTAGTETSSEEPRTGTPSATIVSSETPSAAGVVPPERLRVIIDGDHYVLASSESGQEGKTLDATEIAQLTKSTTGDDQGIRIRIERTKRATAGARQALFEALDAAGITRDSRHESTEFLDSVRPAP